MQSLIYFDQRLKIKPNFKNASFKTQVYHTNDSELKFRSPYEALPRETVGVFVL